MDQKNALTYSPCANCRKLNRLPVAETGSAPICGHCKSQLPLRRASSGGLVNELSASELQLLIEKSPLPVIADFWAPWCGPCKVFTPVFESAARQLSGDIVFAKVDTQANPLAADTYSVRGIPALVLFQDGFERARQQGALPPEIFIHWLRTRTSGLRAA